MQSALRFLHCFLNRQLKIDIGKAAPRDSIISYVYFIGQCFELRICLFFENNNLKKNTILFVAETWKVIVKESF